jgi:threonine dehydrogenase-like Zn-dependent dehydrogenase
LTLHGRTTDAAVLVGSRKVEIRQLPLPAPTTDTGLVAVEVCGVCGADWPRYTGKRMGSTRLPVVLGHEIVGTVQAIGDRLAQRLQLAVGDRVLVEEPRPCGECQPCHRGEYFSCKKGKYGAISTDVAPGLWGGYSKHVHLDERSIVHRLAEDVPAEAFSVAIPVANGLHWLGAVAGLQRGETVLILGPGQHGLGCVAAANHLGAGQIIVLGRAQDAHRMSVAKALGATDTVIVNPATSDAGTEIAEVTAGRMADVVVQIASASPTALTDAMACCSQRARIVNAGFSEGVIAFDPDVMIHKELVVSGVLGRPTADTARAIELIAAEPELFRQMVTHSFSLAGTEQALLTVGRERDPQTSIHVNVRPWAT